MISSRLSKVVKKVKFSSEIANINYIEYFTTNKLKESMNGPPTCYICGDILDDDGKSSNCSLNKVIFCPFDKNKIDFEKFFDDFK
tara:strand:+ start:88 stop:342 length:255 start_codon:yes stop_codon:yes gene_type:complete